MLTYKKSNELTQDSIIGEFKSASQSDLKGTLIPYSWPIVFFTIFMLVRSNKKVSRSRAKVIDTIPSDFDTLAVIRLPKYEKISKALFIRAKPSIHIVLLGGGIGKRVGSGFPKQYIPIASLTSTCASVQQIAPLAPAIRTLTVVYPEGHLNTVANEVRNAIKAQPLLSAIPILLVQGGSSRALSSRNSIAAINAAQEHASGRIGLKEYHESFPEFHFLLNNCLISSTQEHSGLTCSTLMYKFKDARNSTIEKCKFNQKGERLLANYMSEDNNDILDFTNEEVVIIHDQARPLTNANQYIQLLQALKPGRSVVLGRQATNTLSLHENISNEIHLTSNLNRKDVIEVETPQLFYWKDYKEASLNMNLDIDTEALTDDVAVINAFRDDIYHTAVLTSTPNIKFTHKQDAMAIASHRALESYNYDNEDGQL